MPQILCAKEKKMSLRGFQRPFLHTSSPSRHFAKTTYVRSYSSSLCLLLKSQTGTKTFCVGTLCENQTRSNLQLLFFTDSDSVVDSVLVLVATLLNDSTLNRLLKIVFQERVRLCRGQQLVFGRADLWEKSIAVDGGINSCEEDVCAVLGADAFVVQLGTTNQERACDLYR